MAETIKEKVTRIYLAIQKYQNGGPNTRYKSWEWCHYQFLNLKDKYLVSSSEQQNEIADFLALHLGFYLASWGMYRGSSYLLQRDYKTHIPVVKMILNKKYKILWDYKPSKKNISSAYNLLFKDDEGIYWQIKNSYSKYDADCSDFSSETLVSKILLGTFCCVPAFDRYLKSGIGYFNKKQKQINDKSKKYLLSQSLESKNGDKYISSKTFKEISRFALNNSKEFKTINYPAMKCVDMYFWAIGFELDLYNQSKKQTNENKQKKLVAKALVFDILNKGDAFEKLHSKIEDLDFK